MIVTELGRVDEAQRALRRALELARTPAEAAEIGLRLAELDRA